jgi:large subunit ribosomal protein L23
MKSQLYKYLKSAHITEKASDLIKKNQYIFKIESRANKTEIKKAVEEIFKVNVTAVNIINIPAKKKRLGKISGWKKGYKKAVVIIKEGQKIEALL